MAATSNARTVFGLVSEKAGAGEFHLRCGELIGEQHVNQPKRALAREVISGRRQGIRGLVHQRGGWAGINNLVTELPARGNVYVTESSRDGHRQEVDGER